ncbi:PH domain-containing protein [Aquibium carbonis]|uniref:PH domain-containing protein n=1 Tax=Aquibium carbonis TaxID=2495581 RepID=A0A3R9YHS9_9HYPH|nr:PH domain-containing protein [Aquibium carbonis]RST88057.1 PH domain-containing protein [Aquibium carbonis]
MRGDNDNPDVGSGGPFLPCAAALFLPMVLITAGYAATLLTLWYVGLGDGTLARLCILVLALAVPFLAAHALLRRFTIRIDVFPHAVYVHTGFPRRAPIEIPYALIGRLTLERGPVGRLTGSGTLVFEVAGGMRIEAADIARPSEALRAIGRLVGASAVSFVPATDVMEPDGSRSVLQR